MDQRVVWKLLPDKLPPVLGILRGAGGKCRSGEKLGFNGVRTHDNAVDNAKGDCIRKRSSRRSARRSGNLVPELADTVVQLRLTLRGRVRLMNEEQHIWVRERVDVDRFRPVQLLDFLDRLTSPLDVVPPNLVCKILDAQGVDDRRLDVQSRLFGG